MTRHAARCVFWEAPAHPEDWINSLSDAFADLPPGKMLVYRCEVPPTGAKLPPKIMGVALHVANAFKAALVQWPEKGLRADGHAGNRRWLWAIQKA
jgi:hypothetical protein